MPQQSLIDRLKAVEEALGDLIELANTAMLQASNDGAEYNRTEELRDANASLSDLSELIKEAEGQKPYSWAADDMRTLGLFFVCAHEAQERYTKPLYTALGEKP